jgi:catechol 2,3-dioxygenase-like lactoylglutathione lyase family enzyme
MFDHVQIKVADLRESRNFYEAVLGALGFGVVLEHEGIVVGFGPHPHNMFEVRQAGPEVPISRAAHIGFVARSEEAVQQFHATALAHGAADNGAPGLRPNYAQGYYAAFVIDPNGHNLEAVFQAAQS